MTYAKTNLRELEDSAAKHGVGESQEARFARTALGAEQAGMSYLIIKPGQREAFAHKHQKAEEIYVVLSGTGRVKLDEDVVDLSAFDAVRVAPGTTRRFDADADGLELLIFGARVEGDGEIVQGFWDS